MASKLFTLAALSRVVLARCGSNDRASPMSTTPAFTSNGITKPIVVDTHVHIVSNGTSSPSDGHVSPELLQQQMDVISSEYAPYGIAFNLVSTQRLHNSSSWAHGQDRNGMRAALRRGSYADLNLYFLTSLGDGVGGVTGECSFPLDLSDEGAWPDPGYMISIDGCLMESSTMPGGASEPYHGGLTAVHEIGHWFGLSHVSADECTGAGDQVDDTPLQKSMSHGCPVGKDSCPGQPGLDSIYNFMDYADDTCGPKEFTPGQRERMHAQWTMYRAPHLG